MRLSVTRMATASWDWEATPRFRDVELYTGDSSGCGLAGYIARRYKRVC